MKPATLILLHAHDLLIWEGWRRHQRGFPQRCNDVGARCPAAAAIAACEVAFASPSERAAVRKAIEHVGIDNWSTPDPATAADACARLLAAAAWAERQP